MNKNHRVPSNRSLSAVEVKSKVRNERERERDPTPPHHPASLRLPPRLISVALLSGFTSQVLRRFRGAKAEGLVFLFFSFFSYNTPRYLSATLAALSDNFEPCPPPGVVSVVPLSLTASRVSFVAFGRRRLVVSRCHLSPRPPPPLRVPGRVAPESPPSSHHHHHHR